MLLYQKIILGKQNYTSTLYPNLKNSIHLSHISNSLFMYLIHLKTFLPPQICKSAFSVEILDLFGLIVSPAFEENTLSARVFVLLVRKDANFSVKNW